jgi:hypothetical protein
MTEDKPFATLAKAYAAAMGNSLCREIIVLTNLEASGFVTLDATGGVNTNVITIKGKTGAETLTRSSGKNDSVIKIQGGAKVSFKRITVDGKQWIEAENKYSDAVYNRGLLITGDGTKVTIGADAVISGKLTSDSGGGVLVKSKAQLTMTGGEISGSSIDSYLYYGGGVYVNLVSTFTMSGGKISGNTVGWGGGVYVNLVSTFTMSGGEISGNKAGTGGGVFVNSGTFKMTGGEIRGNTAAFNYYGGGVYSNSTFIKEPASGSTTSGVIYGYTPNSPDGNLVGTRNSDKTPATHATNKGHAVFHGSSSKYRNGTLGAGDHISTTDTGTNWDN